MFFTDLEKIPELILSSNFTFFVVKNPAKLTIKAYLEIEPNEKGNIGVESVKEVEDFTRTKQKTARIIHVKSANHLTEAAQNAFLKLLEEPKENYYFVLTDNSHSNILQTILSRAHLFIESTKDSLSAPIVTDEEIKVLAKRLISAKPAELMEIGEELKKKKDKARTIALNATSCAIEMLYKSYFTTGNSQFLKKIPNFITLYENLEKNGHLKLHIVADLC